MDAAFSEDGVCFTHKENAGLSAIFNQRFHYERKMLCSQLPPDIQLSVVYHLERLYGTEFERGEAFLHVNDGGYLSCIEPEHGFSRGLFATSFPMPKSDKGSWALLPGLHPSERFTLPERKFIHSKRKERWKSKNQHYGDDYYILHRLNFLEDTFSPIQVKNDYPQWAENYQLTQGLTGGSTIHDLITSDLIYILVHHGSEPNPVESYLTGRVHEHRIISTFNSDYRDKIFQAERSERIPLDLSLRRDQYQFPESSYEDCDFYEVEYKNYPSLDSYMQEPPSLEDDLIKRIKALDQGIPIPKIMSESEGEEDSCEDIYCKSSVDDDSSEASEGSW